MPSLPTFPTDRLHIRPWIDPVIDRLGHDPRSAYVETYWLGILGPSACWLLRRLADGMDAGPDGFDLDLPDTAAAIGLRLNGGRHAPFLRTLGRICQFRMARLSGSTTLEVRRNLPPLTLAQADHLPAALRDRHQQEQAAGRVHREADQTRGARHLALTLVQLGEDQNATERQLREWRFRPSLCSEVAGWAWDSRQKITASTSSPAGEPSNSHPVLDGAA